MEINVHDDRKIVEIWLSHSEQADAALREQIRPIYQEYNGKKYTVAVFQSGTEDLYEQTHQLLLYNRNRAAVWGDRIFEKCGIRRDEGGDGGKTLEIRGKRRLSVRDGGANYQQS